MSVVHHKASHASLTVMVWHSALLNHTRAAESLRMGSVLVMALIDVLRTHRIV